MGWEDPQEQNETIPTWIFVCLMLFEWSLIPFFIEESDSAGTSLAKRIGNGRLTAIRQLVLDQPEKDTMIIVRVLREDVNFPEQDSHACPRVARISTLRSALWD